MNFFIKRDIGKLLPIPQTFLLLWLLVGLRPLASAQNNALHFDGNNDNVIVSDNNALDISSAFTIECWVYRTGSGHNTIISKWDDDANQRGWMLNFGEHSASTLSVLLVHNGQWSPSPYLQWNSGVSVPQNTWTHIAVTFSASGSNNVKVYKDGVLGGQTTWNYTVHTSTTNLFIGGYDGPGNGFNAGANSRFFAGSIDDLRIWNTTRTATEIADNYQCSISSATSGLVALYEFNQGTAGGSNTGTSSLTNATTNPLNGTLTNFTKTGTTSNFVAGAPAGVASVSIASNDADNVLCNGTTATFTASGSGGGTGATFQWYRNSTAEGTASTSNTLTLTDLADGDVISCEMTSTLSCVATPTVASNTLTISLLTTPTCANGGTVTTDCGCACPPGFTGPTCATAVATTAQGLAFDGSSDLVAISSNIPTIAGTKITLEGWVKLNAYSSHAPIIKKGYSYWGLGITNTGKLEWANDYTPNSGTISAGSAVPLNTWTHVAVVVDGTSCKFYVDGVLNGTNTISAFSDANTTVYLGYDPGYGYSLNGVLDEVRVWNVARSEGEIQAAMNTELAGTETGLKAYYKFNQTSGTVLSDAVGCGNGTLQNFTLSGTTSNWATGATLSSVATASQVPDIAISVGAINSTTHVGTHIIGTPVDFTYTISNVGAGNLTLTGGNYVQLSYGSGFAVQTQPASNTIAAGSSQTFVIRYTPWSTSGATSSATFYVLSDDCDEATYIFTLSGTSCTMATPVATITTSDGDANVCSGFSETFTVSVQDPGNTLDYQWYKNSSPVGTNSASYTDASLAAGDQVYCKVTTTGTCVAQSPVNSNTITIAAITTHPVCQNGGTVNASCGCDCPSGYTGTLCETEARHGLAFDGSNDYLQVPHNSALNLPNGNFTIEAWVNLSSASTQHTIVSKGHGGGSYYQESFIFQVQYGSTLALYLGQNSSSGQWGSVSVAMPLNTWHHVAVSYSGSTATFYLNGAAVGTYSYYSVYTNDANPMFIGHQGYNCQCNRLNGRLDELRIWNVARTASEISDNLYCGVSPSANLLAYYSFDLGTAGGNNSSLTTIPDNSGNGHTATLTNFAKAGTTSNIVAGTSTGAASVSIVSNDNDNALCNGTTATFTATGVAGGTGATFQWYRNSTAEGTASTSNTLTLNDLADGDVISCEMTSTLSCIATPTVTSNTLTISLLATPTCANGGTATTDCSCACPPGFTGPTCATATGTTAQGLAFNGSGDYGYVNSNVPMLSGTKATLEAWVKLDAYSSHAPIIKKGHTYWGLGITNTGKLEWANDYYPNSGTISAGSAVPLNTWTHVAVVVDGTSCKFYVNGVLNGTNTISAFSDANTTVYLGYDPYYGYVLDGVLDEVRVWNVARSEGDIQAAMNTELAGAEIGLKAYYKLNETSGTVLPDAVGCGSGTLSGSTAIWTTGATLSTISTASQVSDIAISVGAINSTTHVGTHIIGTPVDFTYTISNVGAGSLTLTGGNSVELSYGSGFAVQAQPASNTIAAGSPQTFVIRYTPSSTSGTTSSTTFYVLSDDCDEATYSFTLTGTSCAMATPVATITTSDGDANVCAGFIETFTVSVQNPGNTLDYQWYKNSSPVGTNSASYTDASLAAGDQVYCKVTTTGTCVAQSPVNSNTITIAAITTNPVCQNGGTVNASCGCDCPLGFGGPTCATAVATTAQGMAFDGNNYNYVDVPSSYAPILTGTQATIEAWVKLRSSTTHTLIKKGYYNWGLGINGSGQLEWRNYYYAGSGVVQSSTTTTVPQNDWTHVAITVNGTSYAFYIDGQLVETLTGSALSDNSNFLTLGSDNYYGNYLDGSLDEVRVWNVARSAAEIQAAMYTELAGSETGLKAYYKFNQTTGYTLADAVGCGSGNLYSFSMNGTTSGWATGATLNSATTVSALPDLAVYGPLGSEVVPSGTLDLGAQAQNTTETYTITLTNVGGGVLDISGFSFYPYYGYFSLVSGPTVTSLAAGQSTTVTVSLNTDYGLGDTGGGDQFYFSTNDCDESSVYYYLNARSISGAVDPHRGNMLHLDGGGDFVQCASPSNLDFGVSNAFCGEAWVKTSNTTATTMQIFSKRDNDYGWGFSLENGLPTLSFADGGNIMTFTGGTGSVTDGHWHHLAFSNEYGMVSMYVDGYPVGVNSSGSAYSTASYGIDFCIGAANSGSPTGFFDGDIEEVRVWGDTRQQADIRDKMHLTLTGSESYLVSYFQFNESTGNVTDGITGNNGSLQGDASRPVSTLSVAAGFTHAQVVNGPGSYTFGPFSISFSAMSSPGSNEGFFVSQLNDFPLNNVAGLPGTALSHWVIRQAGTQTFSYNTITVVLPVGTVISAADAATPSNFKLYKRETNSAGGWTEIGYGISASIPSRTVVFTISPALTSFSEFVAGSSGSTFPVEWLSFEAERTASGHALLNWATASEHNNAGFGVEYSLDGNSFMELGFVPGAGTSELPLSYRYETPVQEAAYFRLKQTDMNGSASYSETRFVAAVANTWYFAPNPVRGTVKLHGVLPADSYVHTTIHSVDGRLLLNHVGLDAEAAVNARIGDLPAGLYLFQLRVDGKKVATQQMMVE